MFSNDLFLIVNKTKQMFFKKVKTAEPYLNISPEGGGAGRDERGDGKIMEG